MKTTKKKAQKAQEKFDNAPSVIQFTRVRKTRTGLMIVIGRNLLFLNDGLIDHVRSQPLKKAS